MPSLLENVENTTPTQVELIQRNGDYSHLPLAQLPNGLELVIHSNFEEINNCCFQILNDASCSTIGVSIGFDCEWAYQGSVIPLAERAIVLFHEVSLVQIS